MPLYEYECSKCHKHIERIENLNGPSIKKCPTCGGKLERLISAPAIQFKGTGWYVTDYSHKSSGGIEPPAKKSSDGGGDSEKSSSKSAESKSSEKAPAASKETKEKKKTESKSK